MSLFYRITTSITKHGVKNQQSYPNEPHRSNFLSNSCLLLKLRDWQTNPGTTSFRHNFNPHLHHPFYGNQSLFLSTSPPEFLFASLPTVFNPLSQVTLTAAAESDGDTALGLEVTVTVARGKVTTRGQETQWTPHTGDRQEVHSLMHWACTSSSSYRVKREIKCIGSICCLCKARFCAVCTHLAFIFLLQTPVPPVS